MRTRLIISFGLSLLFLYLTFFIPQFRELFKGEVSLIGALFGHSRFDFDGFMEVIETAVWTPVFFTGILFFTSLFLRAWRWRVMLSSVGKMSYGNVFSAMCIGYMANNVLPLRMGEVYRAQVVFEMTGMSRTTAFGSVVLERACDLLFLMPFLGLTLLMFPLPGMMRGAAVSAAVGAILLMAFLLWLALDRERALKLTAKALTIFPQRAAHAVLAIIEKFTTGFEVLKKPKHFLGIAVASLILWVLYGGMVYGVLSALNFYSSGYELIDQNPLGAVLVTLMITTVGFSLPSAPGAVGTYHGMAVLGLSLFDVPGDRAAGFAILMHAFNYIPLTVLGLFFFWRQGLSFRGAAQMAKDTALPKQESMKV